MNGLREYMSLALEWALAHRVGNDLGLEEKALRAERLDTARTAAALGPALVLAIDERITAAVAEIQRGAPPPPVKTLDDDGPVVVEIDIIGEELVAAARRDVAYPRSWRDEVFHDFEVEYAAQQIVDSVEADTACAEQAEKHTAEMMRKAIDTPTSVFDSLPVSYDGERSLTIGPHTFTLPIPIYRDVYVEGRAYVKGDCITRDGSMWICQYDITTDSPGASSAAWKLCVKHGRDLR